MGGINVVEKLKPEEISEFFDMRDLVFSRTIFGTGFDSNTIMPSVFNLSRECADNHWIIKSQGKIVAGVGSIPAVMHIAGERINVGKITGVATHQKEGGKGYMSAIMNEIREFYKANGVMASCLTGERKRYRNFGYEKTGVSYNFQIIMKNIKEFSPDLVGISFRKMERGDEEAIRFAKRLHDQGVIHFERDINIFHSLLINWYNKPYIATSGEGDFAGYLVLSKDAKRIHEIFGKTPEIFEAMIKAAIGEFGDMTLTLPPWRIDYIRRIMRMCENFTIANSGNWLIADWVTVIRALMKAKASYTNLPDGRLKLGIDGYGTLCIQVRNSEITCALSDDPPDFAVDAFTASRLMCGHGAPVYTADMPNTVLSVVLAWFPLPLCWPHPDAV